jgi:hypothetical protein
MALPVLTAQMVQMETRLFTEPSTPRLRVTTETPTLTPLHPLSLARKPQVYGPPALLWLAPKVRLEWTALTARMVQPVQPVQTEQTELTAILCFTVPSTRQLRE